MRVTLSMHKEWAEILGEKGHRPTLTDDGLVRLLWGEGTVCGPVCEACGIKWGTATPWPVGQVRECEGERP